MASWHLLALGLSSLYPTTASANANQPLDRPFTLRNQNPFILEAEYHRMILSPSPGSFIFPRPCFSEVDSSSVCPEPKGMGFKDTLRHRALSLSPVFGYEHRYLGEQVDAGNFGVITQGSSGPVSFNLDARMFTEKYVNLYHCSYDREPMDRQDKDASGSFSYSSFSRFRSNLNYDWSWGRLTVARDAAHWGPGLFTNLVFQQDAIPFNQLTFTTHLGPLTVQSLYGQLAIDSNWETDSSEASRSIYAHRYEWQATAKLIFGISEQLVIYKHEAPFAFVPLVPLYIAKAAEKEILNNGNIAGDISYKFTGWGTLYSEFLIDDLQSPGSIFNDHWGNKWGWMFGGHAIHDWGTKQSGLIAEYSRIEPWVYTHKVPGTAQTANINYPLGNQLGPNSQAIILKGYLRQQERWYVSLKADLTWKGKDSGSAIGDIHGENEKKEWLAGVDSPDVTIQPNLWFQWNRFTIFGEAQIGKSIKNTLGIQYQY